MILFTNSKVMVGINNPMPKQQTKNYYCKRVTQFTFSSAVFTVYSSNAIRLRILVLIHNNYKCRKET